MKTLILSCNNGGGHNSAAAAIKEIYASHGETADIIDAMAFLPQGWSELASDVHSYIYRNTPVVFRRGYHHAETHRKQYGKGHSVRRLLALGVRKLGRYIRDKEYDQVICCHVYAGLMLTDAIRRYGLPIVGSVVETDYTVSPGAEKIDLPLHFVPSSQQKAELASFGVPAEKIIVSGIPTRAQFGIIHDKTSAKERFMLDPKKKNILVACGSMGCGPIEELLEILSARQAADGSFSVSVLCGSNQELYDELSRKYEANGDIRILGLVEDMSALLDSADVYMTKPGGVSVTEAAQKRLPMLLINAVGGCEKHNLEFFVGSGGAVTTHNTSVLADEAVTLTKNNAMHREMEAALGKIFFENNREVIYEQMTRLYSERVSQ
mgnify:FL=1